MSETFNKLILLPDGEQAVVPFSNEELAQRQIELEMYAAEKAKAEAEAAAKAEAKASAEIKLVALGLTPEEIAAISA